MQITIDDFMKVDIRVGTVVKVEDFPKAKQAAYKLWIDFGSLGVKKSSAQITKLYKGDNLIGRQVIAVVNFPPRQIADFMSEVLVLGIVLDDDTVILIKPDSDVPLGTRVM